MLNKLKSLVRCFFSNEINTNVLSNEIKESNISPPDFTEFSTYIMGYSVRNFNIISENVGFFSKIEDSNLPCYCKKFFTKNNENIWVMAVFDEKIMEICELHTFGSNQSYHSSYTKEKLLSLKQAFDLNKTLTEELSTNTSVKVNTIKI